MFNEIQKVSKSRILKYLQSIPTNEKYLFLDPAITTPLNLLIDVSSLRDQGVVGWRELNPASSLSSLVPQSLPASILYMCRPDISLIPRICEQIKELEHLPPSTVQRGPNAQNAGSADVSTTSNFQKLLKSSLPSQALQIFDKNLPQNYSSLQNRRNFFITFVPSVGGVDACLLLLKQNKILDKKNVKIVDLHIFFFPLDDHLISLELPGASRKFHVEGDASSLISAAHGIASLYSDTFDVTPLDSMSSEGTTPSIGFVPEIRSIGGAGKFLLEYMLKMRKESFAGNLSESVLLKPHQITEEVLGIPVRFELGDEDVHEERASHGTSAKFSHMILIDRTVDMITPMLTPFTYEALLDHLFHIKSTYLLPPNDPTKPAIQLVISADRLYESIRYLHQSSLGPLLHEKAQEIQQIYQQKDDLKSINQITDFMKTFKVKQADHSLLATHVNLASFVSKITSGIDYRRQLQFEDDLIQSNGCKTPGDSRPSYNFFMAPKLLPGVSGQFYPPSLHTGASSPSNILMNLSSSLISPSVVQQQVVYLIDLIDSFRVTKFQAYKFFALICLINNGIKFKHFIQVQNALIHQFGFDELQRIINLKKIGILAVSQHKTTSNWEAIKQRFDLLASEQTPDDLSYVFSGYTPITVRLIERVFRSEAGWRDFSDALNLISGPALEVRQEIMLTNQPGKKNEGAESAEAENLASVSSATLKVVQNQILTTGDGTEDDASTNVDGDFSSQKHVVEHISEVTRVCKRDECVSNVLVVFLGGVTYGEVAAIKKLNEVFGNKRSFFIATTEILNYSRFFESFLT